jgi:hypothetical protein
VPLNLNTDAGILKFGVDRVEFFRTGKGPLCLKEKARFVVVVKKTFRYSNVFFYNPLCRNSAIRNIIMKSGTKSFLPQTEALN